MAWHKQHTHCVVCKTTETKHMAKGQCSRCYLAAYRNDPQNHDRIAKCKDEWRQARLPELLARSKVHREQLHFDGQRERALERDGHRCCRCGSDKKLTVHHKDRRGRGKQKPNNKLSNLETVCRRCHLEEHRDEIRKIFKAKIEKKPEQLLQCGRWSTQHDCCVECGTTRTKHSGRGLCHNCYENVRATQPKNVTQKMT